MAKALDRFGSEIPMVNGVITSSGTGFNLTKEEGTADTVRFNSIDTSTANPKLQIVVNGTTVQTVDLNLNDIQINNAGSDFNLNDDILSFVETNGDTATINFSKYNISASVAGNVTTIRQNGNVIATIDTGGGGGVAEQTFTATTNQTAFILSTTPNKNIGFFRNGIKLASNASSFAGTTVTYIPANNGASNLVVGDRIVIIY